MTIYRSNKPAQRTDLPRRTAAALRRLPLACRDCGLPGRRQDAIRGHRQALKCPRCGGFLDRVRPRGASPAQ